MAPFVSKLFPVACFFGQPEACSTDSGVLHQPEMSHSRLFPVHEWAGRKMPWIPHGEHFMTCCFGSVHHHKFLVRSRLDDLVHLLSHLLQPLLLHVPILSDGAVVVQGCGGGTAKASAAQVPHAGKGPRCRACRARLLPWGRAALTSTAKCLGNAGSLCRRLLRLCHQLYVTYCGCVCCAPI